jgi:thymidylate synthase (FAD)
MKVRLVSKTQVDPDYAQEILSELSEELREEFKDVINNPEGLMAYIARVSSPNQTNPTYAKLLKYCAEHAHWSVFETIHVVFEIQTSRMLAPQILRHRSFTFQEFSQRYAAVAADGIELYVARRQDKKNRQNSVDDLSEEIKKEWEERQLSNWKSAFEHYKWALDNEIAKECARAVLPLQTKTTMYMAGTLRSWLHYVDLRSANGTQAEHADIAIVAKQILLKKFPTVCEAMGWKI